MTKSVQQHRLQVGDLSIALLEAGKPGKLLLCLHGFPDNAWTFRHQFGPFAELGYHVVAPFQRGYYPTSPAPDGRYQSAVLAYDLLGCISALGYEHADVIGHDWGALAGYGAAILEPHRIRRLVTIAVPHGPAVLQAFLSDYAQLRRSWYMFFFLTPFAEAAVRHNDFAFIEHLWRDWSPNWDFSPETLENVKATFRHDGVLDAALAYYRCTLDPSRQDPTLAQVQSELSIAPVPVPTLTIHGAQDGCMGSYLLEGMEALFPAGLQKLIVDNAGHFVHQEQPDTVNSHIADFLR
ncbi:MAG: alpha/beta hydrolase [Candidatus Binatia bacterium]|nr:MAG: alpha/beta hydrolase [Candidatus Binatia bacterium]